MRLPLQHLSLGLLTALAIAGPTLKAEDLKYGGQFGLCAPTGDLKDFVGSSVGAGLGLHMLVDLSGGHVLRPRLEGWGMQGSSKDLGFGVSYTPKATTSFLGVDYLYFFEGAKAKGPYLLGGIGASRNSATLSFAVNGTNARAEFDETCTKAAYTLGGGYQFNKKWGLEARYNISSFVSNDDPTNTSYNFNTFQLVGTYRFN